MTLKHKILLAISRFKSKREEKKVVKNIEEKTFLDLLKERRDGYVKDINDLLFLVELDDEVRDTLEIKIKELNEVIEIYTEYGV